MSFIGRVNERAKSAGRNVDGDLAARHTTARAMGLVPDAFPVLVGTRIADREKLGREGVLP